MRSLGVICARANSKGLANKNLGLISGIPLIAYSVTQALLSNLTHIVVSSDSIDILGVACQAGTVAPLLRPAELATDTSRIEEALQHALLAEKSIGAKYDVIILLQNSSPFRTADDINKSLQKLEEDYNSVMTVTKAVHNHPMGSWMIEDGKVKPFMESSGYYRRQDKPDVYYENGMVYGVKADLFIKSGNLREQEIAMVEIPEIRSMDIHDKDDLILANAIADIIKKEANSV